LAPAAGTQTLKTKASYTLLNSRTSTIFIKMNMSMHSIEVCT